MADVAAAAAAILAPQIVEALVELIGSLIERSAGSRQSRFRYNLKTVQIDLGIVKDVLTTIQRNRRYLSEGVEAWKVEASFIVADAHKLLGRIYNNNKHCTCLYQNEGADDTNFGTMSCFGYPFRSENELSYGKRDEKKLVKLLGKIDNINKHRTDLDQNQGTADINPGTMMSCFGYPLRSENEASYGWQDAQKLIGRIDDNNKHRVSLDRNEGTDDFKPRTMCCFGDLFRSENELYYSWRDAHRLKRLKQLENIAKHNPTVIALVRGSQGSRCFPL